PYLLKAGEKAAEESGKRAAGAAWDSAKSLWARFRPGVEARPAALEAARDIAGSPQDADAQSALRLQLRKLLADDESLAIEVARLLEEAKCAGANVIVTGDRGVGVGGTVGDSVIITGDSNLIEREVIGLTA